MLANKKQPPNNAILQIGGVLLNDARPLRKTNVIEPETLEDAWTIPNVPRKMTKAYMTPSMYGSSASIKKLIATAGLVATKEQIKTIKTEYKSGGFSTLVGLKDFLINHANPTTPVLKIDMFDEQFEIEINKYKVVGATLKAYTGYDSKTDRTRVFMIHNPIRIPDYDRFKLFYPTLLIHNRDSKASDNSMVELHKLGEWAISIHDAALVLPGTKFRKVFVNQLEQMRQNRISITSAYNTSIGATTVAAKIKWAKLNSEIEQLDNNIPFEGSCLK